MAFKMVDMLEAPKEQPKEQYAMPLPASGPSKPMYPWGLCITLNDEVLKKLGIEDMPEVGSMIHLQAMSKVTSTGENATEDQSSRRVELQITHLALEDEDDEAEPMTKKLYDKKPKNAAEEDDGDD